MLYVTQYEVIEMHCIVPYLGEEQTQERNDIMSQWGIK